jgi:hypothetical protein
MILVGILGFHLGIDLPRLCCFTHRA